MSYWLFCRRCSLCRGLANTAMHLSRPLQFPQVHRGPEPAALCRQVMASVSRISGTGAQLGGIDGCALALKMATVETVGG